MAKGVEEEDSVFLRKLQESVDANPNDAKLQYDLGVYLWERGGQREKAVEHFVISAKLDPQNGAAFKYLGHYYSKVSSGDNQRAIKCYQRAVTVNPDDEESGEAVCDLLDQEGRESLEIAVCKDASEKSARAFWAYRRLGYLQVHQKKWSEAVQSLQHAIRGYHACADLWEALGLAYQQLGMYTAAVKSYGRTIELDESRVFARIESGNIFMMLGSFKKGVEQFERTLEITPQSLSAHYGLASGLFGLSKECTTMGAFQWGASLLKEASKVAIAGTRLAGNMSSLWKLHGDILITYAKCLPWRTENQASEFDIKTFKASVFQWNESCYLASKSARTSYQKALHLAPWLANIYADIAICSDLICTLNNSSGSNQNMWQLHEKMALGALLLDGDNYELWVTLGCLSDHNALKQHAFIRSLQLDVAVAIAWACLGKLYREVGEKVLARHAFDTARSIDPFLSLPWAGMSADFCAGEDPPDEAFDSCLRAAQTLPLPEFQTGLAKLALLSGNLSSSLVFGAISQAVERAPHLPELHNLKGLVCEARLEYESAVASYRFALHAIGSLAENFPESRIRDVKINLTRTLCKAGNVQDALQECEDLKKEGALDTECLHIYAFSLWQLGQNAMALAVAKNLAANIPTMQKASMAASASFICRLLYSISGKDSAVKSILKMPKEFFQSSKISFIVSAINSLDECNRLDPVVSASRQFLTSQDDITKMHFLIALSKLVKTGSDFFLGYKNGLHHLRKALHKYPNSELLRQSLGYLLLLGGKLNDCHLTTRCCMSSSEFLQRGLKSSSEILGAGAVACYGIGNNRPRFSHPSCSYQCFSEPQSIQQLQKYLHHEPWNHSACYLLILNLLQKAREERFPQQLCNVLHRMIHVALSNDSYHNTDLHFQYEKFQLLLCAAETSFQLGNQTKCISHATNASKLQLPNAYLFFPHLLLCRALAVEGRFVESRNEYLRCLKLGTMASFSFFSINIPLLSLVSICLFLCTLTSIIKASQTSFASQESDRVITLPGQPSNPSISQFSGYITVNQDHGRALFYWFFEAQSHPSEKPLVLWLNGGPGCSSIGYGAASELGPLRVDRNGTGLLFNKYAWNQEANLLFVESPVGVGFSYTNTSSDLPKLDDVFTAEDAYSFVVNWLERFPQYKKQDFFMAGESYAGHYVPQLAELVYDRNNDTTKYPLINLKGFIVGNPVTDDYYDHKGILEYAWSHAVISDQHYEKAKQACDFKVSDLSEDCNLAMRELFASYEEIDIYNIYAPTCLINDSSTSTFAVRAHAIFDSLVKGNRKIRIPGGYDPCYSPYAEKYFNRADVQSALHAVRGNDTIKWDTCNDSILREYYNQTVFSVLPVYTKLINGGLRIWVYSGDADGRVPVIGTRYCVEALGLTLKSPWRTWYYDRQVAGRVLEYEGLSLVTVRGAGHLVPLNKPIESLFLLHSFLIGEELPKIR